MIQQVGIVGEMVYQMPGLNQGGTTIDPCQLQGGGELVGAGGELA